MQSSIRHLQQVESSFRATEDRIKHSLLKDKLVDNLNSSIPSLQLAYELRMEIYNYFYFDWELTDVPDELPEH